jgi:hypothetical protein
MAPRERLVQVTARERVELRGLELGAPVTARVGGPLSPGDERGTRVVWSEAAPRIVAGREPRSADEVLTLSVRPAIRDRVQLGRVRARVVGRARLARAVAPNEQVLHGHAVVVGEEAVFDRAIGSRDTWFVTSRRCARTPCAAPSCVTWLRGCERRRPAPSVLRRTSTWSRPPSGSRRSTGARGRRSGAARGGTPDGGGGAHDPAALAGRGALAAGTGAPDRGGAAGGRGSGGGAGDTAPARAASVRRTTPRTARARGDGSR